MGNKKAMVARLGKKGYKDYMRNLASLGGKAAHEKGVAPQWDSEAAREAGRKGGSARKGKTLSAKHKKNIALAMRSRNANNSRETTVSQ